MVNSYLKHFAVVNDEYSDVNNDYDARLFLSFRHVIVNLVIIHQH